MVLDVLSDLIRHNDRGTRDKPERSFLSSLMRSKVEFVAVDNPHATRLTIYILAAVAEHEAEMISARTEAALAASKVRGTRLGRPKRIASLYNLAGVGAPSSRSRSCWWSRQVAGGLRSTESSMS